MLINKAILTKAILKRIEYEAEYGESINNIGDTNELHDIALLAEIGGIQIEEYKPMYYEMVAIIDSADGQEILDDVNAVIDEEFQSYYLDPAFSSSADYWNYILG